MNYYTQRDEDRWHEDPLEYEEDPTYPAWLANLKTLHAYNRAAMKGSTLTCAGPQCHRLFTKKTYHQCFCRNKGPGNCKDRYFNTVNPRGVFARNG